jgi:hypothetical protein
MTDEDRLKIRNDPYGSSIRYSFILSLKVGKIKHCSAVEGKGQEERQALN